MKTPRTSAKLVGSVVALMLIGTTIAAVTQRESPPVTRVRVCVKDNGQLRMVTGDNTTCGPSERPMDWVVGGEVTDIQPGPGLIGSRDDGAVQLALDPSIIAGCSGCRGGRVFAGFNDGPGEIPNLISETLAELPLPAGDYVIFAKLTVERSSSPDFFANTQQVTCRLTAGADFDRADMALENVHPEEHGNFEHLDGSNVMELTLQVVHSFSAPGSVVLSGFHGTLSNPDPTPMHYRNLKIIAMEASSISNVFLGSN